MRAKIHVTTTLKCLEVFEKKKDLMVLVISEKDDKQSLQANFSIDYPHVKIAQSPHLIAGRSILMTGKEYQEIQAGKLKNIAKYI